MLALLQAFFLPMNSVQAAKAAKWATGLLVGGGEWVHGKMKDKKIEDQAWNEKMGITPSRKPLSAKKLKKMEEAMAMAKKAGFVLPPVQGAPEEVFEVFEIEAGDLPQDLQQYSGEWLLSQEEKSMLFHAFKLHDLRTKSGPAAQRLNHICNLTGLKYEQMKFLWDGFQPDIENLKRLSQNRLKDERMRKSLTGKEG